MSVLAWLMLVFNTAHALPMSAGMGHAVGAAAMAQAMHGERSGHDMACAHPCPATPADGGAATDVSCHCASMCAPALLPVPAVVMAAVMPRSAPAPASVAQAPHPPGGAPLRPPLG